MSTNLVGFDSAWAGNAKAPGAICAARIEPDGSVVFRAPHLVGFDAGALFIKDLHRDNDLTLVAIDQPTIVRNRTGMRPAERVVASLISWSGGGIQPAYEDKASMFGADAPIWRFLDDLRFRDDPETAACAASGGFIMEAYPALALLGLEPTFVEGPRRGPRYNPRSKTFRPEAWKAVCRVTEQEARRLGLSAAAAWCAAIDTVGKPTKALQDRLDAMVCLIIAACWRLERRRCAMIGDLRTGYIVAPVSPVTRAHLAKSAAEAERRTGNSVPVL